MEGYRVVLQFECQKINHTHTRLSALMGFK
ncbi:Uncharacterised protein [Vibrio cholerae]|nr:Uncharacterised protein [Vibrio cholerae]